MLKLLIADADENFTAMLEKILKDRFQIAVVHNGDAALERLAEPVTPDILLINLMLSGTHAMTILRTMQGNSQRIATIVVAPYLDDMLCNQLKVCGVGCLMKTPCKPEAVAAAILDMKHSLENGALNNWSAEKEIDRILISLGFVVGTKRYTAVYHAIMAKYDNPDYVMKQVYIEAAKTCNCSREALEKAIRDAIKDAFDVGTPQLWRHYCRRTAKNPMKGPGNEEFISGIAARLHTLRCSSVYGDCWLSKVN